MNFTRKYYLHGIIIVVLLLSMVKLASYISLAETVYGLFAKEDADVSQSILTPKTQESKQDGVVKRKDNILISRLMEDDQYDLFLINSDNTEEQITDTPYNEMNAQFSPDGKSIVYAADIDTTDYDVIRMELDTKSIINLTNSTASDWDPTFSPDGNTIAFRSNRVDKNAGNGDIFTMEAFGANPKNLTPGMRTSEEWGPTYSPDGTTLYFVSGTDENSEIYSINITGGEPQRLTDNGTDDWYPKVNLEGNSIIHVCKDQNNPEGPDQICLTDVNTKISSLIPNQPKDGDNDDPAWSADGNSIYFLHLENEDFYNLYSITTYGNNLEKITNGQRTVLSPASLRVNP